MNQKQNHTHQNKPVVGITIGDLNGIGPEVIIKALSDNRLLKMIIPVIYGSTKVLSYYRKNMGLEPFNHHPVKNDTNYHPKKINVKNCWDEVVEIQPGITTPDGGKYAFIALEEAVKDLKEKKLDALVTGPIHKKSIQNEQFKFPGHTEYLANQSGKEGHECLMLMVGDQLRVGVVTGHIPVKNISESLTKETIVGKLNLFIKSLKNDFLISKPKIAVLGLNPHAGEEGLLGNEEKDIIIPAINEVKQKGDLIFGPFSSDGFFGTMEYRKYDGVLAMYHDQGLIPFKALSFEEGVNFTAGLPIIRTSPDHGTGFGIAGKNVASETSMLQAIFLAMDIVKSRTQENVKEFEKNPG